MRKPLPGILLIQGFQGLVEKPPGLRQGLSLWQFSCSFSAFSRMDYMPILPSPSIQIMRWGNYPSTKVLPGLIPYSRTGGFNFPFISSAGIFIDSLEDWNSRAWIRIDSLPHVDSDSWSWKSCLHIFLWLFPFLFTSSILVTFFQ